MFLMVCNSILCYLCHTPGMSHPRRMEGSGFTIATQGVSGSHPTCTEGAPQAERLGSHPTCVWEIPRLELYVWVSHPCMYGKYFPSPYRKTVEVEPSLYVWEIRLLTRVNTSLSHISHSLCVVDGSRIFLDGDPQASYLAILVLTCDTNVARPFILSRLSQARLPRY